MRLRNIRNSLNFADIEHPQVRPPLMKSIKGIVIRTEIFRKTGTMDRLLEHAAKRHPIHDATLNSKSDDAAGKLIHHDQYPIRSQRHGFASEEIDTPQTVLDMADER